MSERERSSTRAGEGSVWECNGENGVENGNNQKVAEKVNVSVLRQSHREEVKE